MIHPKILLQTLGKGLIPPLSSGTHQGAFASPTGNLSIYTLFITAVTVQRLIFEDHTRLPWVGGDRILQDRVNNPRQSQALFYSRGVSLRLQKGRLNHRMENKMTQRLWSRAVTKEWDFPASPLHSIVWKVDFDPKLGSFCIYNSDSKGRSWRSPGMICMVFPLRENK